MDLFRVGDQIRASSTLVYATVAAQYLEVIFIFLVGWLAEQVNRQAWRSALLVVAALLLVGQALILTLTRSALGAVVLALLMIGLVRFLRFRFDAFAAASVGAVALLAALLAWFMFSQPLNQLRFTTASDRSWFRAAFNPSPLPSLSAGEMVTTTIQVQNIGERVWEVHDEMPVYLFYHWLTADGTGTYVTDGIHTLIPENVAPGQTITIKAHVLAPAQPGQYLLAWDLLREGLFWFSILGNPTYNVPVTVAPGTRAAPADPPTPMIRSTLTGDLDVDRITLWRAALAMLRTQPLLGVGPGNFRLVLGGYLGRQVWDTRLHANNTFLEVFAGAGLIGGAAFVWLIVSLLRLGWRRLTVNATSPVLTAAVCAALAAFLIHGITDYFLEFTSTYLLFWMTVGMLAGLPDLSPTRSSRSNHPTPASIPDSKGTRPNENRL
jgi:hypothetical protein